MIIVCGFNRFSQVTSLQKFIIENSVKESCVFTVPDRTLPSCEALVNGYILKEFKKIDCNIPTEKCLFSWSYCLFYESNKIWFLGYTSGKDNAVEAVDFPSQSTILQASCNRRQVLCVTDDGHCWQYCIISRLWKNLTPVLQAETLEGGTYPPAAIKVCCGETLSAVLTSKGEVYNMPNKLNLPEVQIVDIACGRSHILMLSDKGEVFSVGEGSRGQLGHGELEGEEEPRLVEALAGLTVVAIACGGWHSCVLTIDGDLYSWGWNSCGQLGLHSTKAGTVSVHALPMVVDWPNALEVRVIKVSCGSRHTVTLLDDGSVWGCGWNGYGQLALTGLDSFEQMTKLPITDVKVQNLICGPWNTCLITSI